MVQTDIHWEVTDTFGGESNYSWVKRGVITVEPGEIYSQLAAVRRVKKAIDWNGLRCDTVDWHDLIVIRPRGVCQICYITFHEHGSAE